MVPPFLAPALLAALLPTTTLARNIPHRLARRQVSSDPSSLSGKTFDYVVVGGGSAGLVVANRLSADPSITVAVIEAGNDGPLPDHGAVFDQLS